MLFASWGDLQPFSDLVDTHGPDAILAAVSDLTEEAHADVSVSTAHKVKGREWPTVRIGNDFPQPKDPNSGTSAADQAPEVSGTDARLAYVSVTRARHRLNLGGLAWNATPQENESG